MKKNDSLTKGGSLSELKKFRKQDMQPPNNYLLKQQEIINQYEKKRNNPAFKNGSSALKSVFNHEGEEGSTFEFSTPNR